MTPVDPSGAASLSRRQWARISSAARTEEEVARAAERLALQLHSGLSPWIGVEGYQVLLERARREVLPDHPVLANVSAVSGDAVGTVSAVRDHGPEAVSEGMVALVACVIELLGRIIGVEMAFRLVEHSGDRPRIHTESRSRTEESSNG